jgi:hypothetical protein
MWRTGLALLALSAVALVRMPVASAADLPEAIARCAEVADNLERLTCYDRQNPPRRSGAARTPDADFGANDDLLRKRQAAGETSVPRGPDRITAKVTKVSASAAGDTLIELENGQVWQQTQNRLETIAAPGDEVTVSKGALGSYFLVSKSRLSTRVKRVK